MAERPEWQGESYLLLDTPLGACGIAWGSRGLVRLQLPEATREATQRRVATAGRRPAAAPLLAEIEHTASSLVRYFAGEPVDLSGIEVDLDRVPAFHREIYAALRSVPWGATVTYGDLARQVGSPGSARAVGQAMGRNPVPVVIPCHRVLASGQGLGGFSAPGGLTTKQRLLALEKATAIDKLPLFAPR